MGSDTEQRTEPTASPGGLARLGAAITAFDDTRTPTLAATSALVAGALAYDAADEACASGNRDRATPARSRARAAAVKVRTALAALPTRLSAYTRAAEELAKATDAATGLTDEQRAALKDVVTGARDEAAAADAFRVAGKTAWPAYEALEAVQARWLDRAESGWYRDQQEAANAYSVFADDVRPALQRARTLLQRVDAARRPVSERQRAALTRADELLAPLRAPSPSPSNLPG